MLLPGLAGLTNVQVVQLQLGGIVGVGVLVAVGVGVLVAVGAVVGVEVGVLVGLGPLLGGLGSWGLEILKF